MDEKLKLKGVDSEQPFQPVNFQLPNNFSKPIFDNVMGNLDKSLTRLDNRGIQGVGDVSVAGDFSKGFNTNASITAVDIGKGKEYIGLG